MSTVVCCQRQEAAGQHDDCALLNGTQAEVQNGIGRSHAIPDEEN